LIITCPITLSSGVGSHCTLAQLSTARQSNVMGGR
jgi:hypothetical protein